MPQREERYRSLAESITQIIWVADTDGHVLEVSDAFVTLTGHPKEMAYGRRFLELIPPEDVEAFRSGWGEALASHAPFETEFRLRKADGTWLYVRSRSVPVRDESGAVRERVGTVTDITATREAEAARRASEELFFKAFDNSPVALGIRDIETGRLLQCNGAHLRLTGFSRDEVLGRTIEEAEWVIDRDAIVDAWNRLRQVGRAGGISGRLRRKSGELLTVDISAEIATINGRVCALITLVDQTPRVDAEARLMESEERFRRLSDAAWEGIALSDQGVMIDTNAQLAAILGYEQRELIGRPVLDLVPPGSIDVVRGHIRTDSPEPYEHDAIRKDGSIIRVEARGRTVPYGGRTIRMTAIRDITERRDAESRRRALIAGTAAVLGADFFRSLVRHLAAAFAVKCALVAELIPPDRTRCRALSAWADREYMAPFEFDIDGTPTRHVVSHGMAHFRDDVTRAFPDDVILRDMGVVGYLGAPLLDSAQQPLGVLAVFHDRPLELTDAQVFMMTIFAARAGAELERVRADEQVAKRRQVVQALEEQLRHSQKLEAVGQLAGGVAHDFNNLLTVINGYSERLLAGGTRDSGARGDIELIHKAGQRAAALTSQLLAFSRRQVLQPKIIELNAIVVDMNKMLQRVLGEHITTIAALDPSLGATLADPGQLGQVVMNLAINARDAMPDGGTLTIETANVDVAADEESMTGVEPGRYVSLVVRDTGHGMDQDTIAHIFEPFFTTKEIGKGSGLGLPTVYGIVKQSGGEISVESEPDAGTTVRVLLPRVEGTAAASAHAVQSDAFPRGHETILLVEDEDLVRDLVREFLEEGGYHVVEAQNGEEALRIARAAAQPIDLVVTDVVLPGIDGSDLVGRLRTVRPSVKALYVSGYPGDAMFGPGGFDPGPAFLAKPFTRDVLIRKVREVLDQKPAAAGTILVVDDDAAIRRLLCGFLRHAGYRVFERLDDVPRDNAARARVDVVLYDVNANQPGAIADLAALQRELAGTKFVVMTAALDNRLVDATVDATLQKPLNEQTILDAVARVFPGRQAGVAP